jgi:hypothetical protein
MAFAVARFVCPLTFTAGQERARATEGYIPAAAKKTPTYETPGLALGEALLSRMM